MMDDRICVTCRPRRGKPPTARTAAAVIATAGLVLLAAACGGSPGRHSAASAQENGALAFSNCMRSHGVSNFPDPNSSGAIPKIALERLGVLGSQFQAGQRACQHLLPTTSSARHGPAAAQALQYSECMRGHRVTNFPDPDPTGSIPDPATLGINQGAPQYQSANQACAKYRPPYMPSNAAYDAYARTHGS